MQVREGLYYNPYFPGGAIAMPKMLADGGTEYDDGTEATESQQAKVRVTYLSCKCSCFRLLSACTQQKATLVYNHCLSACPSVMSELWHDTKVVYNAACLLVVDKLAMACDAG